ncbi:MAG: hypothetical protein HN952_05505 [Candidatus Cloacimonetes bacterium]|jgi:hypothetical protein|nr:hypothetical protein [Candidatus Cloacimonadota bacterium]MBT7469348.1 hypothetical protein [Candidatus Cloacimonadota bacterium]
MKKRSDFYVKILKYAESKGVNGFTFEELYKDLKLNENEKGFLNLHTMGQEPSIFWWADEKRTKKVALTFEGKFKLLEFEELEQARKSSRNAMRVAIFAIIISIVTGISSINYSKKQLDSSGTIDKTQFEEIKNLKFNSSSIDSSFIKIIEQQKNISSQIDDLNDEKK